MLNKLSKLLIVALLMSTTLMAQSDMDLKTDTKYRFKSISLIGFEGGMNTLSLDSTTNDEVEIAYGGIKVGAETNNFRIFLNFKYGNADALDNSKSYGAEADLLLNFASWANFFIGINGGKVDLKELNGPSFKDSYLGVSSGLNFHLGDFADIEIGGRMLNYDKMDSSLIGYGSFIFKFQMD